MDDPPHRLVAETFLAAQRGEEPRVNDRGLAAARAADDGYDIRRRTLANLPDQLFDEALAAEEQARVLLAERQKAAIGREAGKQLFRRGGVDRLALRARDEALEAFRLIEAVAQIDPGVEAQKAADRDGVVCEPRQQHRDDRKRLPRLCRRRLTVEAELNLAVLPLAEALGSGEHDERAARRKMLFEPGLPGLSGGEVVPIEESVEARLLEPHAQRLRLGRIGPRVAQKDVASPAVAHKGTIHKWIAMSRFAARQNKKALARTDGVREGHVSASNNRSSAQSRLCAGPPGMSQKGRNLKFKLP